MDLLSLNYVLQESFVRPLFRTAKILFQSKIALRITIVLSVQKYLWCAILMMEKFVPKDQHIHQRLCYQVSFVNLVNISLSASVIHARQVMFAKTILTLNTLFISLRMVDMSAQLDLIVSKDLHHQPSVPKVLIEVLRKVNLSLIASSAQLDHILQLRDPHFV